MMNKMCKNRQNIKKNNTNRIYVIIRWRIILKSIITIKNKAHKC